MNEKFETIKALHIEVIIDLIDSDGVVDDIVKADEFKEAISAPLLVIYWQAHWEAQAIHCYKETQHEWIEGTNTFQPYMGEASKHSCSGDPTLLGFLPVGSP